MLTPYYVFDLDILDERINYLKSKLEGIKIIYAMKANPFLVKEIVNKVSMLEVCSLGELKICLESGIPLNKLVISGVYKEDETYDLINEDSIITIESVRQFEKIKNQFAFSNLKILPRLSSSNQFGLSLDEIIKIVSEANSLGISVYGLQYYSGTQKQSLKKIERELNYLKLVLKDLQDETGVVISNLEYGPGFPVSYFYEDFDEESFLNEFMNLVKDLDVSLCLEIGRSLVASSGFYVTKVVDVKTNYDNNYAIVDGGIHQLSYYGQFMASKKPEIEIISKEERNEKVWNICGSLCTVNDLLIKQLSCKLGYGDIIVFKNVGAYSVTEGISLFLSHNLPEVFIKKERGGYLLKTARNSFNTYKLNMTNKEEDYE